MAKQRPSFGKRERERAKAEKARAKEARRQDRSDAPEDAPEEEARPVVDQEKVLAQLAALHQAYEDGDVTLDDFEEQRAELTARLTID